MVFAVGGWMEMETAVEIDMEVGPGEAIFDRMMLRISLALLRARVRTYEV